MYTIRRFTCRKKTMPHREERLNTIKILVARMLTDLWALDRYSETQHLNYLGQNPPKDHFRKVW